MFEKLIFHRFLHSSTKIQLRSSKLIIMPMVWSERMEMLGPWSGGERWYIRTMVWSNAMVY